MEIAISIYRGGEIVRADDKSLNYYSYANLGLLCPICAEEVYLKKGDVKRPHFAHFHKTDDSKKCTLRLKANILTTSWQNIVEGQGQRREIFQKHFLEIIANSNPEFHQYIQELDNQDRNFSTEDYIARCSYEFHKNKNKYIENINLITSSREDSYLNRYILIEAIEYLMIDSCRNTVLTPIVFYIIHKDIQIENLWINIIDLLLNVNWQKQILDFAENITIKTNAKNAVNIDKENSFFDRSDLIHIKPIKNQYIYKLSDKNLFISKSKINFYTYLHLKKYKGIRVCITGHTISNTEIDSEVSNKNYSYEYAVGDIYLQKRDDSRLYEKYIGTLTEDNINCIYEGEFWLEIINEIRHKCFKKVTQNTALKKIQTAFGKRQYNKESKKQKNTLIYTKVLKIKSRIIKNRFAFQPNTLLSSDNKKNILINNTKYNLFYDQKDCILNFTKNSFFENKIFIKGFLIKTKSGNSPENSLGLMLGIVCFTTRLNVDVILGELTFDQFNMYLDVKKFLVEDCKLTSKDIKAIENECLKSWCAVYKLKRYLDKEAKNKARNRKLLKYLSENKSTKI